MPIFGIINVMSVQYQNTGKKSNLLVNIKMHDSIKIQFPRMSKGISFRPESPDRYSSSVPDKRVVIDALPVIITAAAI